MNRQFKEKICKYCGKKFIPNSGKQIYCKGPHYTICPICGSNRIVQDVDELRLDRKRACSKTCKEECRRMTLLQNNQTLSPGSSPEARIKARQTMDRRYGGYTLSSEIIKERYIESIQKRYNVDNISRIKEISEKSHRTQKENWNKTILEEFPFKPLEKSTFSDLKPFEEDRMQVYMLRDKESVKFLKENGHQVMPKWGKIHKSIGLVLNTEIYQVLRFEKCNDEIILADFGTREGFFNPNNYTLLLDTAIDVMNIDSFTCEIPRSIATLDLIYSLSLELVEKGMYQVFWVLDDGTLKRLTIRDNIQEMKKKFQYVTSDYIDTYKYVKQQGRHLTVIEEIQTLC